MLSLRSSKKQFKKGHLIPHGRFSVKFGLKSILSTFCTFTESFSFVNVFNLQVFDIYRKMKNTI